MEESMNKPKLAGENMGRAIIEMVYLMYQKQTAKRFLESLIKVLQSELNRRVG